MRVIKSDSGFQFFEKMFNYLLKSASPLVMWQISPASGERQITNSYLSAFNPSTKKMVFHLSAGESVIKNLPLYCYAKSGPIIFKVDVQEIFGADIGVTFPKELKLLEDDDNFNVKDLSKKNPGTEIHEASTERKVIPLSQRSNHDQRILSEDFEVNLDEEDRIYADKRESPRARPRSKKRVKVAKFKSSGPVIYKLIDLSRGGIGLISKQEDEFIKGEEVHIVGFDNADLDDPLVGEIMSVRPIEGPLLQFKVGVQFRDGQD